jgi:hydrogenase nickel incorporation protein HypA/HybF
MEVVGTVEKYLDENAVTGKVESLTLEIGEISSIVPKYVSEMYPAATGKTVLEGSELIVETIRATARCKGCGEEFLLTEHKGICPVCGSKELELLSGREFYIKEIAVSDG